MSYDPRDYDEMKQIYAHRAREQKLAEEALQVVPPPKNMEFFCAKCGHKQGVDFLHYTCVTDEDGRVVGWKVSCCRGEECGGKSLISITKDGYKSTLA